MGFPIYSSKSNRTPPYLYGGLMFNSVLALCIVLNISFIVIVVTLIRLIVGLVSYMFKLKGN